MTPFWTPPRAPDPPYDSQVAQGRHDLFAVLGITTSVASGQGWDGLLVDPPEAVAHMLSQLAPLRTMLLNHESKDPPCGRPRNCPTCAPNQAIHQFSKWSKCAELVLAEETSATRGVHAGRPYGFILVTRPDTLWRAP